VTVPRLIKWQIRAIEAEWNASFHG